MSSGESGVLRGGGSHVAICHIPVAACQSVLCSTHLNPRLALSSEKSCEATCQYTIFDRVSFYGFIYRKSLSGLLDIRSFVNRISFNRKS